MHWHIHPRRNGDTPNSGPVWQLGNELFDEKYNPTNEELEILKKRLVTIVEFITNLCVEQAKDLLATTQKYP